MHGPQKYATATLVLAAGVFAPAALAATTAQESMTVTPSTPATGSTVTLSASNIPAQGTSLPQSITLALPGFSTATAKGVADSTTALCTPAQASSQSCPAASQVSNGTATVVATLQPAYQSYNPGPVTATLAGYLEAPTHSGAVADVALVFASKYGNSTVTGYLESAASGLTLSIPDLSSLDSQFAAYESYIQSINLQSLSLTVGAHTTAGTVVRKTVKTRVRTRVKTRVRHGHKYVTKYVIRYVTKKIVKKTTVTTSNYLLTNPDTCTSAGWTGSLTLGYASGPQTYTATAGCTS